MNLLLDLGNTRLKWAWHDGVTLHARGAVAHAEPGWAQAFGAAVHAGPAPSRAWLAAVGADAHVAVIEQVLRRVHPACALVRVHSPAAGAGVVNAYSDPQRLGVDRFLALVGARGRAPTAALVAGCGTALAIDAIDAEGRHLGGVIAPGETIMQIVPTSDEIIIEAEVRPQDIEQIYIGQTAVLHFPGLERRTTPRLYGKVAQISADLTKSEIPGAPPFFAVRLKLAQSELKKLEVDKLLPGMPAEAFIQTHERSPIDYLLQPLTDQVARTFRER